MRFSLVISTGLLFFLLTAAAGAQPASPSGGAPEKAFRFSYSAAPIYQFSSDLDGGGDFSVTRFFADFNVVRSVASNLRLGLGVGYQYADYDFSGATRLGSQPWNRIHSLGFSVPVLYTPAEDWTIFLGPSFRFDAESGADWGDAFTFGGILSASYRFGPDLTLGPGVGVFNRFGEVKAFPFLAVFWKINDQFRVSNPFQAGPVGPAGLELVYTPDENWELALGGAYRSFRFRLDDADVAPDGSGEERFFPLFVRLGRRFTADIGIELLGGVLLGGELTIDNEHDTELASEDYDPTPFLSLLLSGRF